MTLRISVADVEFGKMNDQITVKSLLVRVSAISSPDAITEIAEKSKVPEPGWFYHLGVRCSPN